MNYWSVRIDRNELLYHHRELSPEGMHFWLFPASAPSFTYSQRVYIPLSLTRYKTLTGDINYFWKFNRYAHMPPPVDFYDMANFLLDRRYFRLSPNFLGIGTSLIVPTSLLVHPVCTYASSTEKKHGKVRTNSRPFRCPSGKPWLPFSLTFLPRKVTILSTCVVARERERVRER